ncbi:MAG: orotidine-5'-phosphate decarboxylase [Candidatus Omnitrophota bacterium]|nr:orotidine-5'-phosphate decarboxylase [Candidatus Omnitrophota bacterium]
MKQANRQTGKQANIILALDVDNFNKAKTFVDKLYPEIKIFKVGIQLFVSCGHQIIKYIRKKRGEVFLDLKFFDIPNTTAKAIHQAVRLKVKMITLHILGDAEMLKSAVSAAQEEADKLKIKRPLLIGVTVLTSKDTASSDVLALAKLGIECGLDGVVCSAQEAALLKQEIKKDFLIVTPGIRPVGTYSYDQKRTTTAQEAIKAGSNFLVIGRPILEAPDPLEVIRKVNAYI